MAPEPARSSYTAAEYLALERASETRSELVNGQILAMTGASRAHNLIAASICREIGNHLKGRPCEAYQSDMRVKVSPTGPYTYPDVLVVCGQPQLEDEHGDTLLNPTVIVEVLTPSSEAYDRGEKFAHYRRLESLREYLVVAQDQPRIERYVRDGEHWVLSEASGLGASLDLPSTSCRLALADVYDKVTFEPEPSRAPTATIAR
ncbi:MAG: Uma2 family endonuclease [Deltaproteobacteria bacterium]|nr:Uma2 family endonuclease [Deltaproteobacteria bacterium]